MLVACCCCGSRFGRARLAIVVNWVCCEADCIRSNQRRQHCEAQFDDRMVVGGFSASASLHLTTMEEVDCHFAWRYVFHLPVSSSLSSGPFSRQYFQTRHCTLGTLNEDQNPGFSSGNPSAHSFVHGPRAWREERPQASTCMQWVSEISNMHK